MAPRGKIGKLPVEQRNAINRMIRDNADYADIIAFARDECNLDDLSPQNISSWKENGYQEWLRRQHRVELMQGRVKFAQEFVDRAREAGDDGLTTAGDAASMLATDAILETLEDFDSDALKEFLAEKPGKFMDLIFALQEIRGKDQSAVKLRMQVDKARRLAAQAQADAKESGNVDLQRLAEEMDRVLGG